MEETYQSRKYRSAYIVCEPVYRRLVEFINT
jgi:hypothetical protein